MSGNRRAALTARHIVSIGECMVELARRDDDTFQLSFGGDTFNTAVYMARLGGQVSYLTALGDDPYSDGIIAAAQTEGIDTGSIARHAGRMPGLYLIETDAGERSFWYWRDRAPARELFDTLGDQATHHHAIDAADIVYFSGVTLSLYSDAGLSCFADILETARAAGARIVMDSNFRTRGWRQDVDRARRVFERFWRLTDIALPSIDDEMMLWGPASAHAIIDRIGGFGPREVVLKCGADGAIVAAGDSRENIPCAVRIDAIDTTAAGDSFNAAYICARLEGQEPSAATSTAHRLAGLVVQHRGAIIPSTAMAAFDLP